MAAVEEEEAEPKHGGSRPGKKGNTNREWATGHMLLFNDYFTRQRTNDEVAFHWRFKIGRASCRERVYVLV